MGVWLVRRMGGLMSRELLLVVVGSVVFSVLFEMC